MPAPDGAKAVLEGQLRIRMLGDVDDREVIDDKTDGQAGKRCHHQNKTGQRQRARHTTPQRESALRSCETEDSQR